LNEEQLLIRRTVSLHDREAFTSLVKMHQGRVRAFLVRLSKQYDIADDISQETFITAYKKLGSYQGKGDFIGWLMQIAYRCFLQHRRNNSRREQVTEEYGRQFDIQAERYESISAEQLDLEKAMALLTEDEAATITLCHGFGYSHQEVSTILSMPLGTVKTHINRGKIKLREALALKTELEKAS
jgi:RNA polymerase sigma-70 factor, ECF subfamily